MVPSTPEPSSRDGESFILQSDSNLAFSNSYETHLWEGYEYFLLQSHFCHLGISTTMLPQYLRRANGFAITNPNLRYWGNYYVCTCICWQITHGYWKPNFCSSCCLIRSFIRFSFCLFPSSCKWTTDFKHTIAAIHKFWTPFNFPGQASQERAQAKAR